MRFLMVGYGAFGSWFTRTMIDMGHEVIVVERDADLLDRHADEPTRALVGDATDPVVLERAGARDVDAAVIGTSRQLATTILTIVALRDLEVRNIYAKVASLTEARALEGMGITEAVFPESEAGFRLAHRIASKSVLDYTPLGDGFSLQEMAVPEAWTGRTLVDLDLRHGSGIQVVAVRDALTGELSLPPDPAARLKPSDSLLVAGRDDALEEIADRGR